MTPTHRLSVGLAVLATAAAIGLAACGSSSSPHVANVGKNGSNGSGNTTTTLPKRSSGNGGGSSSKTASKVTPSQLLDKWAACMRKHGDPNQADPSIDAHGVIHITWNPAIPGGYNGTNKGGHGNSGPGQFCRTY